EETDGRGFSEVNIMFVGDLIHAQSVATKPDMKLSGEFPEVQATIECFKVLAKYIDRLVKKYRVKIGGVVGNESRFSNHLVPSNLQSEARNSMDVIIYEMLRQRYRDIKSVKFLNEGDETASVVSINGKSILLTHGNSKAIDHRNLEKSLLSIKVILGGDIDYVLLGHIHSTYISDKFARNSSLVGSNAYSNEIGFAESTVAQNMLIIDEWGIKAFSLKV
ncbi:MAG: hypothetical protein ACRC6B_07815, partial [Fusobacteriaceae bacterium]